MLLKSLNKSIDEFTTSPSPAIKKPTSHTEYVTPNDLPTAPTKPQKTPDQIEKSNYVNPFHIGSAEE